MGGSDEETKEPTQICRENDPILTILPQKKGNPALRGLKQSLIPREDKTGIIGSLRKETRVFHSAIGWLHKGRLDSYGNGQSKEFVVCWRRQTVLSLEAQTRNRSSTKKRTNT